MDKAKEVSMEVHEKVQMTRNNINNMINTLSDKNVSIKENFRIIDKFDNEATIYNRIESFK